VTVMILMEKIQVRSMVLKYFELTIVVALTSNSSNN